MRARTKKLAELAILAALYAALTMALAPLSFGPVQARFSEALCILPFFIPETCWSLFAGCLIANIITGNLFDVVFGAAATLAAGALTALIGRRCRNKKNFAANILACAMPVLVNAVVIGAVITYAYNGIHPFTHPKVFALYGLQIAAGESIVMFGIGLPLFRWLPEKPFFQQLIAGWRKPE